MQDQIDIWLLTKYIHVKVMQEKKIVNKLQIIFLCYVFEGGAGVD